MPCVLLQLLLQSSCQFEFYLFFKSPVHVHFYGTLSLCPQVAPTQAFCPPFSKCRCVLRQALKAQVLGAHQSRKLC